MDDSELNDENRIFSRTNFLRPINETEDIRQFVVDGKNWETIVEVDVSKYSHLEFGTAQWKIREEVCQKGIAWFKKQEENLKMTVCLGVYEKVEYKSVKDKALPQLRSLLDRDSAFVKTKRDTWLGGATSYAVTNESLQKQNETERPEEIWHF